MEEVHHLQALVDTVFAADVGPAKVLIGERNLYPNRPQQGKGDLAQWHECGQKNRKPRLL